MARAYGGKHSPNKEAMSPRAEAAREAALNEARVDAAGGRANLLFVPPVILAFTALDEPPALLVTGLLGAAALALAAWLLREGLRAEAAYNARAVARRPALPRKILASLLTGLGVGMAAASGASALLDSALYGVAALGLHVAAFGIDPLADKRTEGVDRFQQDRVARVVDEAEEYLAEMKRVVASLGDRKLDLRVAGFQAMARRMIRTVEEDPRDLTEARRFLGVYLMGARDASARFAELYARRKDEGARADYEALLGDLETNFAARTDRMLESDRSAMDIEIKVLRDRLSREGVRTTGEGE